MNKLKRIAINMTRRPSDVQIHVNPNRPKTPGARRAPTPTVQSDVGIARVSPVNSENTSETIFIRFPNDRVVPDMNQNNYGSTQRQADSESVPLLANEQQNSFDNDHDSDQEDDLDEKPTLSLDYIKKKKSSLLRQLKIFVLIILTAICTVYIVVNSELVLSWQQLSVSPRNASSYTLDTPEFPVLHLQLRGPLIPLNGSDDQVDKDEHLALHSEQDAYLSVKLKKQVGNKEDFIETWVMLVDTELLLHEDWVSLSKQFNNLNIEGDANVTICFETNYTGSVPLEWTYHEGKEENIEEICAGIVLALVYIIIMFDLVHRTLAAILGSLASIAVMSAFGQRPTLETIITWLDIETLSLLFGMMVIVSIFSETGFFDYCALKAYQLAKGQVWSLITLLCVFSAVVSAFLDNVTTILLLTPVTIRLCEVLNLDPRKILIAEVLFSNIGGTATAIGDPPNVIIVSDKRMAEKGIEFSNFTGHMVVGIIFVGFFGYGLLRLTYRNVESLENKDPVEISELKHEIDMWRRAAFRMVAITREESVMKALFLQKAAILENRLIRKMYKIKKSQHIDFKETLSELEKKYRITDKILLAKSGVVLTVVILAFFMHSFVDGMHVGLGWIAIMGAIWLMVLADVQELENILHRVEWSTLIFFAALFALMEALTKLGLIQAVADGVISLIENVGEGSRLAVAILLIVWCSALASSFIDNIPFTTAMVPVLLSLTESFDELPLLPLVLALAFGACLGGNGTLIGASANVVCAGIAEQHGYGFSFWEFFKVGFPMMLLTTAVATAYLMICHVWGDWNYLPGGA